MWLFRKTWCLKGVNKNARTKSNTKIIWWRTSVKDISLKVNDGEIVSILGPSGWGKTTLLNLILGIVNADSGQILYNGEDLTNTPM